MKRIDCLRQLAAGVTDDDLVIASLGGTGLEWGAVRPGPNNLFLIAMGCNTPVAIGLALALKHRRIILLETDGSLLLGLGALATLGNLLPANLRIVVFDNEGYERVNHNVSATKGRTDLAAVAKACGIESAHTVRTDKEFAASSDAAMAGTGLSFIVAKVDPGIADVPGRPTDGIEEKYNFVRHIERLEGKPILAGYRAKFG